MVEYGVAIRTLGKSGDRLKKELCSIYKQTIRPKKVLLYIAEGYKLPDFRIEDEEYVYVKKGMVAQRAIDYKEIQTEWILLLDDDVFMAENCVETLYEELNGQQGDCIAADVFRPHEDNLKTKIYNYITNLSYPRKDDEWAFKVVDNASFSYNGNPSKSSYHSQSAAGPISLWRRDALLRIHYPDELWLDRMGFAFGDDQLMFQKLYKNGFRLLVSYDSGAVHMDAKSSSSLFQESNDKYYRRAKAMFLLWYRSCYDLNNLNGWQKKRILVSFSIKQIEQLLVHFVFAILSANFRVVTDFIKGNMDGYKEAKKIFRSIPNFILS